MPGSRPSTNKIKQGWITICAVMLITMSVNAPVVQADNETPTVITDIANWHHPVKKVFARHKIQINKVVLLKNKTYPVFYVKLTYDPQTSATTSYYHELYAQLLKANSWWSYALHSEEDKLRIEIDWDKTKKEININYVPLQADTPQ